MEQSVGKGGGCGLIPHNTTPAMADVMDVDVANRMSQKKQVMDERFLRRIEGYRRHHNNSEPRFSKAFSGHAEQNYEQTMILKQKYLETKGKRQKKTEKKQTENSMPNSLHPAPVSCLGRLLCSAWADPCLQAPFQIF